MGRGLQCFRRSGKQLIISTLVSKITPHKSLDNRSTNLVLLLNSLTILEMKIKQAYRWCWMWERGIRTPNKRSLSPRSIRKWRWRRLTPEPFRLGRQWREMTARNSFMSLPGTQTSVFANKSPNLGKYNPTIQKLNEDHLARLNSQSPDHKLNTLTQWCSLRLQKSKKSLF